MGKLKILADGNSPFAQAQARGKLFEKLMAEVLRHFGYSIDSTPSVNYAGMEIDIEGRHTVTGIPLYAECKCYDTEIDSPKLRVFFANYMTRWFRNNKAQGLFIALPGVNSHADGFYRENCETNPKITLRLYQEEQVLNAIYATNVVSRPEAIARLIKPDIGIPGDWDLLFTDKGLFWVQYVIPEGSGMSSSIALFDATGHSLSDKTTLDYLKKLYPGLDDFQLIIIKGHVTIQTAPVQEDEEIVEVSGSSACFEYQFPASPEHFVGRQSILEEVDHFTQAVISKEITSRAILFQADSGWGKSSVVLASVARLKEKGHFAIAIDSRSASSSQFIIRVIGYTLNKLGNFNGLLSEQHKSMPITGFDGATKALINIGKVLEQENKVLFIFLDQFENVFFLPDTLKRIRDLVLKVCDIRTNIVLGFSWKTDLIGSINEFPHYLYEAIVNSSRHIALTTFSEVETTALLRKLSQELRSSLRKDLAFFLSEFSQGYPWLLKKLCAHVKSQREAGVQQSDMANSLLNVEELFQTDLRDLLPAEMDTLQRIAKVAPISIQELGEEFKPEVVQRLVNARLVVRIANKYDIYWDIFRDYLNSGHVPIQENYILRLEVGSVLKATKILTDAGGSLNTNEFQTQTSVTGNSFYNLMRDMRLLGLAIVDNDRVILQVSFPETEGELKDSIRVYLREKLRRNRLVWQILKVLESRSVETDGLLTLAEVADILATSSPYTSAAKQTWRVYARVFANWMSTADLAVFDSKNGILGYYKVGMQIREHRLNLASNPHHMPLPQTQYRSIEKVVIKIGEFIQENKKIDWASTNIKESILSKALATLEHIGFIKRNMQSIELSTRGHEFVTYPEKRLTLFTQGALEMESFRIFIEILNGYQGPKYTLSILAEKLKERLGFDWKDLTAMTYTKILLEWARHTGLAPRKFQKNMSKSWQEESPQGTLFEDLFAE